MHIVQAPFDEMLAIVGEQAVAFLAEARPRTADDLFGLERLFLVQHLIYRTALRESRE
jgi:hypothetical protein